VYHGVGEIEPSDDPHRLVTAPQHLAAHIRLLRRLGHAFVTAEELVDASRSLPPQPGTAVLTFDDGWRDALHVVAPTLRRLDARASFYVCPGWWGGQHPELRGEVGALLTEAEVAELAQLGMEIGSHSMSHPDLRTLDDALLAGELRDSKEAIERTTGTQCRTFAYPFGLYDDRVVAAVADAGYELALTWQRGPWHALEVPRLPAPPRGGASTLALKLAGVRRRR
jgi:peptidoglycan/xylan/chitin deacetylase (PgdA/CDA1 family)